MIPEATTAECTVDVNALTAHWRAAFTIAADALADASSLGFATEELALRKGRLAGERETTARLLSAISREMRRRALR